MIRYCIWLTFDSNELRDTIIEFAKKYNCPIFQPHITLLGRIDANLIKIKSAIYNIIEKFDSKSITPNKVNYTEDYSKSYFLEIKEKQTLTNWHKRICDILNIESDKEYIPHISLMYNELQIEDKEQIELPFKIGKSFRIKSIQITECHGEVENWQPIFELKVPRQNKK